MDESPGDDGNTGGRALALATRDLFNEIKTATAAVTPFRFLALLRQLFPQFAQVRRISKFRDCSLYRTARGDASLFDTKSDGHHYHTVSRSHGLAVSRIAPNPKGQLFRL